jgi:hypothetical protein
LVLIIAADVNSARSPRQAYSGQKLGYRVMSASSLWGQKPYAALEPCNAHIDAKDMMKCQKQAWPERDVFYQRSQNKVLGPLQARLC